MSDGVTAPTPDEAAARDLLEPLRKSFERTPEQAAAYWERRANAAWSQLDEEAAQRLRLHSEVDALRAEVERARDREQAVRDLADRLAKADSDTYSFGSWSVVRDVADQLRAALGPVETPQEETRG